MSVLRFHLLGPLEARRDGVPVELGPRKQRAVLALLLLNANRVVPTERLIDGLWGDSPPDTARSALQVYIAGLRKALGADGSVLRTASPGYVLDVQPGTLDLDRFTSLGEEARAATDPARRVALLDGALALWRGEPLGDLASEPFATAAADRARAAAAHGARRTGRGRARARAAHAGDRRAEPAGRGIPVPRALPRAADARALPLGAAGGCARGVPGGARELHDRARARARARAEEARAGDPRAGSGTRRAGRASI